LALFKNVDAVTVLQQGMGKRDAGDACADDGDVHDENLTFVTRGGMAGGFNERISLLSLL
jgi:hypothetical protein